MASGLVVVLLVGSVGVWLSNRGPETSPVNEADTETGDIVAAAPTAPPVELGNGQQADERNSEPTDATPEEQPADPQADKAGGFWAASESLKQPATTAATVGKSEASESPADEDAAPKPTDAVVRSTKYKLVGDLVSETEPIKINDLSFGYFGAANAETPIFAVGGARPLYWKNGSWQESVGELPKSKAPKKTTKKSRQDLIDLIRRRSGSRSSSSSSSSSSTSTHVTTMSSDGALALVDWKQGLSLLDTRTGDIRQLPSKVYGSGRSGVITADGNQIVVYMSNRSVRTLTTDPLKVASTFGTGSRPPVFTPRVFVSENAEQIYLVNSREIRRLKRGAREPVITELSESARGVVINPTAKTALVATNRKSIMLIDISSGDILDETTIDFSSSNSSLVISPGGGFAAVRTADYSADCLVLKLDGSSFEILGMLPTKASHAVGGIRFISENRIAVALRLPFSRPPVDRSLTVKQRAALPPPDRNGLIAVYELPD
jgi:hypothetical protein